ncbi:MAG: LTA synthase family protein, partial [Flavobacteriaceae bacterium]|nr:LTA synthase family protein [Flavobacteriaceae bacterium]
MIKKLHRTEELKTLLYRLFLAYMFFSVSRVLFLYYNLDLIEVTSFSEGLYLCYLGLRFDTTSIVYLSSLFVLMSILPGTFVLEKIYQKVAKGIYFFGLSLGMFLNFVDIAYYRFNLMRLNANLFESIENEVNKTTLFFHFLSTYFYLVVLFALLLLAWNYFYDKKPLSTQKIQDKKVYYVESAIFFFLVIVTCIGGVRGGKFLNATRPIATIHTMEKIKNPQHADILLNSSFSIFRTIGKTGIQPKNQYSPAEVEAATQPFKQYTKSLQDSDS